MPSLTARVGGVLYSPRATFASLLNVPRWADVLILTFLATSICTVTLLQTDVGQLALLDQWERTAAAFGRTLDDAQYSALEEASRNDAALYAVATSFARGPLLTFALSVVFFAVFRSASAEGRVAKRPDDPVLARRSADADRPGGPGATFQQVLAIVSHASVILALRQLITAPLMYARESLASPVTVGLFVSPLNEASPLARFSGIVDLFVLWWIVVLAIGIGVLYRRSARRLALRFVGIYLMLAVVLAVVMAATGGTA